MWDKYHAANPQAKGPGKIKDEKTTTEKVNAKIWLKKPLN